MKFRIDDNIDQLGDEQEINRLITLLGDADDSIRANAAEVLTGIGKPAVLPLIDALKDEKVWYAAIEVLTEFGELAVPALMFSLRDDYIANFAIHAIMGIGEPALLPLLDALRDTDSGVRSWAVVALKALSDRRTVEPLIDILKDEDTSVRLFAAEALGKIGDERSLPALRWLQQQDSYIQVKDAATEAIARIEGLSQKTT